MVIIMNQKYIIEKIDHFGRGITKINNKIAFIENALPNELVEIKITKETKKYIEGVTTKVIKESSDRTKSNCPYYHECGGCNIRHLEYMKQLKYKEQKVKEILKKFADIETEKIKNIVSGPKENYRNKITLKVKNKIGLYKKQTYELINIGNCNLVSENINKIISRLNNIELKNIDEIIIRNSYEDKAILNIKGKNINKAYLKDNLKDYVENIVVYDNDSKEIILGEAFIIDKIGTYLFLISDDSFFQVNKYVTTKLYDKVKEYVNESGESLLDLYCGTGTIGIYLSEKFKSVTGIEINKNAIANALENKKINNITNINFICDDVGKNKRKFENVDVMIIDPPRNGLTKEALKNVLDINAKKIIYVSCDPVTLARDLKILKEFYEIKEITPFDMFPDTYHVETVCLLSNVK